jgi:hypothetical protein
MTENLLANGNDFVDIGDAGKIAYFVVEKIHELLEFEYFENICNPRQELNFTKPRM